MIVESVRVQRYRSIFDETLALDDLTTLLGANGSGKSAFLRALDLFYSNSPKLDSEDFYGNEFTKEIVITVTFGSLNPDATELFSKYLQDERLTIEKVFVCNGGKITSSYHGGSLRNPAFDQVRVGLEVKDRGATAKGIYDTLARDCAGLPVWTTLAAAAPALREWEETHPEACAPARDDGRFFGFTGVGEGYLGRFSRFLFIPAVRDASTDASEGKGSALTDLMDMVVRSVIAQKAEVLSLKERTQQQYEELLNPENLQELGNLSTDLTSTLQTYVPTASVSLSWLPLDQIEIKMPKADIKLVEDNFGTAVHRTGHGLQRAFILTMLQHLALAQSVGNVVGQVEGQEVTHTYLPNLLLAIEEPELFQHPSRQRHFATILSQLASGGTPGVAAKTQVVCATHSPLFVALDRFSNLRIIRKYAAEDGAPGISKVVSSSLRSVAEALWMADGNTDIRNIEFSAETLLHRLRTIMTSQINEGFFANVVVLVEGEDDLAALNALAALKGVNLDALGVALISVGGKRNLDRPALIFRALNIPVFVIWDADSGQGVTQGKCVTCERTLDKKPDPKDNHRLLRIVGQQVCDWPSGMADEYCCFEVDLETTLSSELGADLFDEILASCQVEFGIPKRKHAIKNPSVISEVLTKAAERGAKSQTLEEVIERIIAMAS